MDAQPVTTEQLARLYAARNEANAAMSRALRSKDKQAIQAAKDKATRLNRAYNDAHKAYKRAQKTAQRARWRTTMIRWYMDCQEARSSTA